MTMHRIDIYYRELFEGKRIFQSYSIDFFAVLYKLFPLLEYYIHLY